jgi:hypothetical protein
MIFTAENSTPNMWAISLCNFRKTSQRIQSPNMRKIAQSGHPGLRLKLNGLQIPIHGIIESQNFGALCAKSPLTLKRFLDSGISGISASLQVGVSGSGRGCPGGGAFLMDYRTRKRKAESPKRKYCLSVKIVHMSKMMPYVHTCVQVSACSANQRQVLKSIGNLNFMSAS